jgi:hemoglobin
MRSLYEQIGGDPTIETVVDELYSRLTTDPRVRHHFAPERLPQLKLQQRRWFRSVLGGADETDRPDLHAAHRHLEITDEQVRAVLDHLDRALATAEVDTSLRTKVIAVVTRLWYARRF